MGDEPKAINPRTPERLTPLAGEKTAAQGQNLEELPATKEEKEPPPSEQNPTAKPPANAGSKTSTDEDSDDDEEPEEKLGEGDEEDQKEEAGKTQDQLGKLQDEANKLEETLKDSSLSPEDREQFTKDLDEVRTDINAAKGAISGLTNSDWGQIAKDVLTPDITDVLSIIPIGGWLFKGAKIAYKTAQAYAKASKALRKLAKLLKAKRLERERRRAERIRRRKKKKKEKDCKNNKGNPVNIVTGAAVDAEPSFALPSLLPIIIGNEYDSQLNWNGPCGRNRISFVDQVIFENPKDSTKLTLLDDNAMAIEFDRPKANVGEWSFGDGPSPIKLAQGPNRSFILKDEKTLYHLKKYPDLVWRMTRIELDGQETHLKRDRDGVLHELNTPEGYRVVFHYNAQNLRSAVDFIGLEGSKKRIFDYAYDDHNNLTHCNAFYGEQVHYGYDAFHNRSLLLRNNNYQAEHIYENGRVTHVKTNAQYNNDRFEYDTEKRISYYIPGNDPAKRAAFHYNEDEKITLEINALGHAKHAKFDKDGYLVESLDGEGNKTAYDYDSRGNLKLITDPEERDTFLYWNPEDQLEIVILNDGKSWDYFYDSNSILTAIQDPQGYRTDIVSNDAGQPTRIMRHDGLIESRTYDAQQRLIALGDFSGNITRYAYDEFGRLINLWDANGQQTQFLYQDQRGSDFWSPWKVVRPDGVSIETIFDIIKSERRIKDGQAREMIYRYGPRNLLMEMEDPKGGVLHFHYDGLEQLEAVTNQTGQEWRFIRDVTGRIIFEEDFDGLITRYAYDKADRVIEVRYNDETRLTYRYDRSGLLLEEHLHEAGKDAPSISEFSYDARGQLIAAKNKDAETLLERDALGRIIAETTNGIRIENSYDCCGNRTARQILGRMTHYRYDPLNALKEVVFGAHAPLIFSRDALGRETNRHSREGFQLAQQWDQTGQLTHQKVSPYIAPGLTGARDAQLRGISPHTSVERGYTWTKAYEPLGIEDKFWGALNYNYDQNGQVIETRFGDGARESFTYDSALNIAASEMRQEDATSSAPLTRRMDDLSRFTPWLTSKGGRVETSRGPLGERIALTWDERGRVIERRVERDGFRTKLWRYQWDGKDRLILCITPDHQKWRYGYDVFGRRIFKINLAHERIGKYGVVSGTGKRPQEPDRGPYYVEERAPKIIGWAAADPDKPAQIGVYYLWDGDTLAADAPFRADDKPDFEAATWWHFEPSSFRPLAKEKGNALSFIVTDHLGTPREIFSEAGTLQWAAEYTTWGAVRRLWVGEAANDNGGFGDGGGYGMGRGRENDGRLSTQNPRASGRLYSAGNLALKQDDASTIEALTFCPIRFQGQWEDEENGLYYNRFRYYDKLAASYVSPDPIGLQGGLRSFGYVERPTWWLDPLGLAAGVYMFQMASGNCYIGKGGLDRFAASKKAKSSTKNQVKRCKHKDLTSEAAKAGVDGDRFAYMVESRLMSANKFGQPDNHLLNVINSPGANYYSQSSDAVKAAVNSAAAKFHAGFAKC